MLTLLPLPLPTLQVTLLLLLLTLLLLALLPLLLLLRIHSNRDTNSALRSILLSNLVPGIEREVRLRLLDLIAGRSRLPLDGASAGFDSEGM